MYFSTLLIKDIKEMVVPVVHLYNFRSLFEYPAVVFDPFSITNLLYLCVSMCVFPISTILNFGDLSLPHDQYPVNSVSHCNNATFNPASPIQHQNQHQSVMP